MQGMAFSHSSGPIPYTEIMDREDPLKEVDRDRRNALLNKVQNNSFLLALREGMRQGEELGGLTPNLRV